MAPALTGTYRLAWEAFDDGHFGDQFRVQVTEKDEDNSYIYLNLIPLTYAPRQRIEIGGFGIGMYTLNMISSIGA